MPSNALIFGPRLTRPNGGIPSSSRMSSRRTSHGEHEQHAVGREGVAELDHGLYGVPGITESGGREFRKGWHKTLAFHSQRLHAPVAASLPASSYQGGDGAPRKS